MAKATGREGQQQVIVRMPVELKEQATAHAESLERSLAQHIRFLLRQDLRAEGESAR